jgi:glycosyltransferase involved in cell wall biosynthesis
MNLIPLCMALRDRDEVERAIAGRNGTRLLSIGRLEDVKNIDSLLRIFAKLKEELPQATLTIAGEYTGMQPGQAELYKDKLLEIVRSLKLEANVRFAGPVDGEEKERLFRTADLLVNLSTDPGETFGYNLIEAKVWGVPVLCANWNGFREVVSHGEDGILIDCEWPDDGGIPRLREDQAAEWAVRLLRDERLRAAMSGCAAERAGLYGYETVFPSISAAIARAESSKASTHRAQTGEWMLGALSELPDAYHVDSLRRLPFFEEPLIDIVSGASTLPLRDWMPAIRPIIGHYAGRFSYAEL